VSLVAGLVVAMAVAVLSHEATASFNEEIRVSGAEAALRGAADRLRSDLQRASFMSTPNIQADTKIGKGVGQPNVAGGSPIGLQQLQGIYLLADVGGSGTTASNGLAINKYAQNAMYPSTIDITGNMTTVDQFAVQSFISPPTTTDQAAPATCCQINLVNTSDSVYRALNANDAGTPDPNADEELRAIFQPVSVGNTGNQFMVRYVDTSHQSQYLLTCPGAPKGAAGGLTSGAPYVLTATCPVAGITTPVRGSNSVVNPVQTVQWEIVASTLTAKMPAQQDLALDRGSLDGGTDGNKYNLIRSFVDSATQTVIPETTEVIAEYAVDMDFAFSVDTGDTTGTAPSIIAYDFGDANNATVAGRVTVGTAGPATPDPQRIRSVRFRLATRAALPDRTGNIPPVGAGGGAGTFAYRYCMPPSGNTCSGNALMQWARVRTIVSEVALPNQEQVFF
jgi:hypothetical protein